MTTRHVLLPTLVLAVATTVATSAAVRPALQRTQRTADRWCNNDNGDDRATYNEVRDFAVPASGATLTVDASPNGGIRVVGESRGDIQAQACVTATAATDEQARALAQRVEVTATAQRISADGPQNLGRREGWHVSYRLTVPNRTSLSLRTTNGGISLADVDGDIDFRTVNGGVSLTRVAGKVHGGTTNGGVDVDLEGSTWKGDGLEVETQNGGVEIAIPANYSARLETGTVNGRMNIDFPVTVQGRIGRSIETQLGSGGPLIKVRTSNGGVNIRRK
jgi:DUF4097 and DUF4098 domain-containing protein YvlB